MATVISPPSERVVPQIVAPRTPRGLKPGLPREGFGVFLPRAGREPQIVAVWPKAWEAARHANAINGHAAEGEPLCHVAEVVIAAAPRERAFLPNVLCCRTEKGGAL